VSALRKVELCPVCRNENGWHADESTDPPTMTRCPNLTRAKAETSGMDIARLAHESAFDHAVRLITEAARANAELDANTVREVMTLADIPGPVIGAAFAKCARDGLIREIGRVPSSKANTNAHRIAKYQSRLFGGGGQRRAAS